MTDRVISHEVPAYGPASLNMLSEFENATTSNRLKVFSSFEDFPRYAQEWQSYAYVLLVGLEII